MTDASKCGNVNVIPGISFFTAVASIILSICTTALNGLVLRSIYILREKKLNIFFYKLLLNISVSDIMTGIFTDLYSAIFHVQEGLLVTPIEIRVIHVTLYLLGSVPLATLVLLCIDRVVALLMPLSYRHGPAGRTAWLIVLSTWVISTVQIAAYFRLGFIPYLVIFAAINIAGASFALFLTSYIFHKRMKREKLRKNNRCADGRLTVEISGSPQGPRDAEPRVKKKERRTSPEKSATKAFQIMSVVNVATYLPTCFATAYMNACTDCNCMIVHSMRDIAIVSILSGSLFRAITLLSCLRPLRSSFCSRKPARQDASGQNSKQQSNN